MVDEFDLFIKELKEDLIKIVNSPVAPIIKEIFDISQGFGEDKDNWEQLDALDSKINELRVLCMSPYLKTDEPLRVREIAVEYSILSAERIKFHGYNAEIDKKQLEQCMKIIEHAMIENLKVKSNGN